jgi:outer membrane protein
MRGTRVKGLSPCLSWVGVTPALLRLRCAAVPPGRPPGRTSRRSSPWTRPSSALEHAPAAVAPARRRRSARADLLQSRGALLPSLGARSIYNNSSNQRFDQATGQLVSESYTAQVSGSYEVFSGGPAAGPAAGRQAGVDAAEARYLEQTYVVVLQATETYYAAAAASRTWWPWRTSGWSGRASRRSSPTTAMSSAPPRRRTCSAPRSRWRTPSWRRWRPGRPCGPRRWSSVGWWAMPARCARGGCAPGPGAGPAGPGALVERGLRSSPAVRAAEASRVSRSAERLAAYTPYIPSLRVTGGYDWFAYEFPPDQRSWSVRSPRRSRCSTGSSGRRR